jgi:hypothetical protein
MGRNRRLLWLLPLTSIQLLARATARMLCRALIKRVRPPATLPCLSSWFSLPPSTTSRPPSSSLPSPRIDAILRRTVSTATIKKPRASRAKKQEEASTETAIEEVFEEVEPVKAERGIKLRPYQVRLRSLSLLWRGLNTDGAGLPFFPIPFSLRSSAFGLFSMSWNGGRIKGWESVHQPVSNLHIELSIRRLTFSPTQVPAKPPFSPLSSATSLPSSTLRLARAPLAFSSSSTRFSWQRKRRRSCEERIRK